MRGRCRSYTPGVEDREQRIKLVWRRNVIRGVTEDERTHAAQLASGDSDLRNNTRQTFLGLDIKG